MRKHLVESLAFLCLAAAAFADEQPSKLRFSVSMAGRGTFGSQVMMEKGSATCSGSPTVTCDVSAGAGGKRSGQIVFSFLALPRGEYHSTLAVGIQDSTLSPKTTCSSNARCSVTTEGDAFLWSVGPRGPRGVAAQRREEPGWGCGDDIVRCTKSVWSDSTKSCTSPKLCGFATLPVVKDEAAKKCRPTMTAEQACARDARTKKCCEASADDKCPCTRP
jgi:hypothetical protein